MTDPQNPVSAPGWQQSGAPVAPQQYPPAPGQYAQQGQFQQAPAGYQQAPAGYQQARAGYQQAPAGYQQGAQQAAYRQAPYQPAGQPYPPGQYQQAPHQYQQAAHQQPHQELSGDFIKHTGMLIWWQQSTRTTTGTFEQVAEAYKGAQLHNLLAGWWSISSAIALNWWAIFRNMYEFSKVKKAAGR